MLKMLRIKPLLAVLVFLVIADGFITHYLVSGGIATEGNPLLQPIVGDWGFIFLKIGGACLCAVMLLMYTAATHERRWYQPVALWRAMGV